MEILPYYFISYNCLNKKYKSFYSKIKNLEFDKVADCELNTQESTTFLQSSLKHL